MIDLFSPRTAQKQAGLVAQLVIKSSEAGEGSGGASSQPSRVLLIEDDHAIAEMYRLQLESDGYQVAVVANGTTGWHRIQRERPDLVLLDLRLPGMDGFQILEACRASTEVQGVPVVVLSNFGDTEMVKRARSLGARDYLVKSRVTPDEVSGRIRNWISRPLN